MELLFVAVIAAVLGIGVRYAIPGHDLHGVLLVPAVATAAGMAVWVALLWAGLSFDGGWIWVASLAAAIVASAAVALLLPRRRRVSDSRLRRSLGL